MKLENYSKVILSFFATFLILLPQTADPIARHFFNFNAD